MGKTKIEKDIRKELQKLRLVGLRNLAKKLGNSGYSKLKYQELIIYILENNKLVDVEKGLGLERRKRRLKVTAAIITVPVAILSFWYVLWPNMKNDFFPEKNDLVEIGDPIFADTFEIVPFPHDSLLIGASKLEDSIIYSGIQILEEERFYDFRRSKWIEDLNDNPFGSPVCLKRNIRINKNFTCHKVAFRFSSSGTVTARCTNFGYKCGVPDKVIANIFEHQLMTSIDIIIDLSQFPQDTMLTFNLEATYFNAFQKRPIEWIGTSNLGTSLPRKSSIKIYFPEERRPEKFYACGYVAYDTTCYGVPGLSILSRTDSLTYSWLLFTDGQHDFLDGIDSKWEWKR